MAILTEALKTVVSSASLSCVASALEMKRSSIPWNSVVVPVAFFTLERDSISVISKKVVSVPSARTQTTARARVSMVGTWQRTDFPVSVLRSRKPPAAAFAVPVFATIGIETRALTSFADVITDPGEIPTSTMFSALHAGTMPGHVVKVKVPVAGIVPGFVPGFISLAFAGVVIEVAVNARKAADAAARSARGVRPTCDRISA